MINKIITTEEKKMRIEQMTNEEYARRRSMVFSTLAPMAISLGITVGGISRICYSYAKDLVNQNTEHVQSYNIKKEMGKNGLIGIIFGGVLGALGGGYAASLIVRTADEIRDSTLRRKYE